MLAAGYKQPQLLDQTKPRLGSGAVASKPGVCFGFGVVFHLKATGGSKSGSGEAGGEAG